MLCCGSSGSLEKRLRHGHGRLFIGFYINFNHSFRMQKKKFETIDEYISLFPEEVQALLQKIRITIHNAAPEAEEAISYQMPTFKLNGNLVHFAAYEHHIGFYPIPSAMEKFAKELSLYTSGKGSVQFPLDGEIPY